jgi:hypothetical protein
MQELYNLEGDTVSRAVDALKALGWQSDKEYFPKEARLAADRAAAHLASGGKGIRQRHSKLAPPSTGKQGKGGTKGGAAKRRPQTPALQFKVAVWDYLPSPVVQGFANSLNLKNNLEAHSSIESM